MKTFSKIILFVVITTVSLFITSCRKDITMPNPELEKLFGSWDWVSTSGGYIGSTKTPVTEGYSAYISFDKKGITKMYKDGKKKETLKYTLTETATAVGNTTAYIIHYKNKGICNKNTPNQQIIRFGGQDTLFLSDIYSDGFFNIYTRKL